MPGVNKEQIAKAREWDLLAYLQTFDPNELKPCGPNEYCTRSHDSLKISNGKWCWHSRGIGGRTALDYLVRVQGVDFVAAVETLCGYRAPPPREHPAPKSPKPFELPVPSRYATKVMNYLQRRGIDAELIGVCIQNGSLYQSRSYQNCVFVGYDSTGDAKFAALRGTRDNFKLDVPGSDKRFSFCLPAADPDCPRLAVAESPVDALSVASLVKRSGEPWQECHYLSLGGTAPMALLHFLQEHRSITQVSLCLDNDGPGLTAIQRLTAAIQEETELAERIKLIYPNPSPVGFGKDYNEFLCTQVQAEKAQRRSRNVAR